MLDKKKIIIYPLHVNFLFVTNCLGREERYILVHAFSFQPMGSWCHCFWALSETGPFIGGMH